MAKRLFYTLIFFLVLKTSAQGSDKHPISGNIQFITNDSLNSSKEVYQLRIYTLYPDTKNIFYESFKNHTIRIMKRHNFNILGTWETNCSDKVEFIYLLKWSDSEIMDAKWTDLFSDDEWLGIKKAAAQKYGTMVENIQNRLLTDLCIVGNFLE